MFMPRRPNSPSVFSMMIRSVVCALALAAPLASALADSAPSSIEEAASILSSEAQSLQNSTDYSYSVSDQGRQAVSDFSQTAQGLDQCLSSNNSGVIGSVGSFGNVPSNPACVALVQPVIQSFQAVDDQLAQTDVTDSEVYNQYIRTRQAVEDLRNLSNRGGVIVPGGTGTTCIGSVCVGTTVQVVRGAYAGQVGRVVAIERNSQMLTILAQRGQYIYARFGEVRPAQQRDPGNGGLVQVQGFIDQNHFSFASANRQQIYSQCLEFGARLRKSWVNQVTANGSTSYQPTTIGRACEFVMSMAR